MKKLDLLAYVFIAASILFWVLVVRSCFQLIGD